MKSAIFFICILPIVMIAQSVTIKKVHNKSKFNNIKVGMKDTQVEKTVGLPDEISKGFTELTEDGFEVKTMGQLNYTRWIYHKSKMELILENWIDTIYIINGIPFHLDIAEKIQDTLFYDNSYGPKDGVLSKDKYYYYKYESVSSDSLQYGFIPVKTKKICITDNRRIAVYNKCVLFDPSSNRVVNVDFYPASLYVKVDTLKRLKGTK